jgi:hypothetical protein
MKRVFLIFMLLPSSTLFALTIYNQSLWNLVLDVFEWTEEKEDPTESMAIELPSSKSITLQYLKSFKIFLNEEEIHHVKKLENIDIVLIEHDEFDIVVNKKRKE